MNEEHRVTAPAEEDEWANASRGRWWKPVLLITVVVVLFVLAIVFDAGAYLGRVRDWIDTLGPWGPVVFILVYVAATLAAIPGTPLTVAAGGLFGAVWGVVYVSIGATVGAALCFLVARYFARDAVSDWLRGNARFRKLDRLTERHGGWIVAITRLVPIFPYNLLNYGFGLTRVKFGSYVLWSAVCMLPATVVYVVGTDAIVRGIEEGRVPWALVGVVGGVVVLLVALGWFARGKLKGDVEE